MKTLSTGVHENRSCGTASGLPYVLWASWRRTGLAWAVKSSRPASSRSGVTLSALNTTHWGEITAISRSDTAPGAVGGRRSSVGNSSCPIWRSSVRVKRMVVRSPEVDSTGASLVVGARTAPPSAFTAPSCRSVKPWMSSGKAPSERRIAACGSVLSSTRRCSTTIFSCRRRSSILPCGTADRSASVASVTLISVTSSGGVRGVCSCSP
ncbi:hypothetical protein [Nonomuraea dietziae]|uniref:hypothetical protein n=1 Tax=Nonomuraea dietziae TaxID=65515 RepID=UPI0031E1281F